MVARPQPKNVTWGSLLLMIQNEKEVSNPIKEKRVGSLTINLEQTKTVLNIYKK